MAKQPLTFLGKSHDLQNAKPLLSGGSRMAISAGRSDRKLSPVMESVRSPAKGGWRWAFAINTRFCVNRDCCCALMRNVGPKYVLQAGQVRMENVDTRSRTPVQRKK